MKTWNYTATLYNRDNSKTETRVIKVRAEDRYDAENKASKIAATWAKNAGYQLSAIGF